MKALIIEDEPRARAHMQKLLSDNFPAVEVVGAIGSVKDSLEWLRTHPAPEVIFMDVELSDGNSFEIFSQTEIPCPVIMTTAYDQYAVHAFEVNAVDYLLKPIEVADLKRAIQRVASGEAVKPAGEAMRSMMDQVRKEKFLIRLNDRIVPVRTSDIAYFYSEAKNSYIVTLSGSRGVFPHLPQLYHQRGRDRLRLAPDGRPPAHLPAPRHSFPHGPHRLPRPRRWIFGVVGEVASELDLVQGILGPGPPPSAHL